MARLARWCFRHRMIVAASWLVVLCLVFSLERALGDSFSDSLRLPGTESSRAFELLRSALPEQAGGSDTIVWHTPGGSVTDPEIQARMQSLLEEMATLPGVERVSSPYEPAGAGQISADGRTAYATIAYSRGASSEGAARSLAGLVAGARGPGLQVELGGDSASNETSISSAVAIGVVAAGVVILIAFGSLFGMLLPLITAGVALGITFFGIGLLSHGVVVNSVSPTMAMIVGLGVGIDYALFVVTRYRRGLKTGAAPEEAAVEALNTAGRAVIFAGATVCVALLGLLLLRIGLISGLAYATALAVALTMASSVTLLPAMLGFMGTRLLSRRERRRLVEGGWPGKPVPGLWERLGVFVSRRPVILTVVALIVMVLLASPALDLRLGLSDAGNDPASSTTRKAYDLLTNGFGPGFNGPLLLVAQVSSPGARAGLERLAETLEREAGVAAVVPAPSPPDAEVVVIQVIPTTAPQDRLTSDLIARLRSQVIPAAREGSDLQVLVGGGPAFFDDFGALVKSKLPLFVGIIVALGFVLLVVAFRSLVVPATAALMNLLAATASIGVVVAFFQWGWGSDRLGLGRAGPIEAFLPVIMLAVLFGLSMDYQVFLVSRIHEEWVRTRDNRRAVIVGQMATGRVITAAAAIMICVFAAFVFEGQRVIAQFGVGLAVAVFLDAFLLRTFLVPALMHLFGRANWWLPRVIDRHLPHLAAEPPEDAGR